MVHFAVLLLAQGSEHTQEAPDGGVGAGLIIGAVLLAVLVFTGILVTFARRSKLSRGGVQPPAGERRPGAPPVESVERGD